jgi:hypothetical protein
MRPPSRYLGHFGVGLCRTQRLGGQARPPKPRVFVLVVAVTKVTILSTLFSLKEEEQDYIRKEKLPAASLSSLLL